MMAYKAQLCLTLMTQLKECYSYGTLILECASNMVMTEAGAFAPATNVYEHTWEAPIDWRTAIWSFTSNQVSARRVNERQANAQSELL